MTAQIFLGLPENVKYDFTNGIKIGSPEGIIDSVSAVLNIESRFIKGNSRKREFVEARQIAIGLIYEADPKLTLKTVGRIFNQHHATIIYSKRTFDDLYLTNKSFKQKVLSVKRMTHYA